MSGNPYPDHPFATDREEWEEYEASYCDLMAKGMRVNARVCAEQNGWDEHNTSPTALASAHECAIRAKVWEQMAQNLRRARISRIERSEK
jgi:hypothetical protein